MIGASTAQPDALALAALIVGVFAVIFSAVAAIAAVRALNIASAQHDVFQSQLRARARLEITLGLAPTLRFLRITGEELTLERLPDVAAAEVILQIGVTNVGGRVASDAVIATLAPRGRELQWCDASGYTREYVPGVPTAETLTTADGTEVPVSWIDTTRRIALRTSLVMFAKISVGASGELDVPLRIRITCDDLEDSVTSVEHDATLRVRAAD